MLQQFKIIEKKNLTPDVYEITFEWEKDLEIKPWQFVTFLLPEIGWRAYSILEQNWNKTVLIIKKRELENGWRWWSKYICEREVWEELKAVGPAGHFLLKENKKNKLFIGTGTWLVPLYNMIIAELEKKLKNKVYLTFWIREETDIFYIEQLEDIKKEYPNFDYEIYISRVKDLHKFKLQNHDVNIHSWYTTNHLTKINISKFEEFYICWAPKMIESTVEKLENLWFKTNENIFYEKY